MKSNTLTKTILILLSLVFLFSIGALSTGILNEDVFYSHKQEILKDIRMSQEDNYEDNDHPWDAYDLSIYEEIWLSAINGFGAQYDYDFYEISVSLGDQHLQVDLIFAAAGGYLDIEVLNDLYYPVAVGHTMTDNQYIDCIVPTPGTYYFWIYGDSTGIIYNLKWNTTSGTPPPDDNYEENDLPVDAFNISSYEETWLSTISGPGVQYDDDWYEIYVNSGYEYLRVNLTFIDANGDLNIGLYAYDGSTYITGSTTSTDNESINVIVPSAGTYYLKIYDYNVGNTYDLWWNDTLVPPDDSYEDNNYYYEAYNLSLHEDTWLSTISGPGVQFDNDWYEIYVNSGYEYLQVNLTFIDADGDLNIGLYASDGSTYITGSDTPTDNEFFNVIVPSAGPYYILVNGEDVGNEYDLWWDDFPYVPPPDDNYEENDDETEPYNLSSYETTWLSSIDGLGVQLDDDWYEIYIDPGDQFLRVKLTFSHAEGSIDIELYDASFNYIAGGWSDTDNEYINTIVPTSGIYYLRILGSDTGNEYDLWWDDTLVPSEDNYEENDDETEPFNLSSYEATWLSSIDGLGVQLDEDWYEIYVDPGDEHLMVTITFIHAGGDINLAVADQSITWYVVSFSTTDNESIDVIVPSSGTYYILVYGEYAGNEYDLWWDDLSSIDDNYEENDAYTSAYDFSAHENDWLSIVNGTGVQFDEDWYEITIDPGYEQLIVDLSFTHIADNLDLGIYDSTGTLVTESTSSTDDEHIDYVLPSSGTYYIKVYGNDIGNEYDLRWNSIIPDDNYEENDDYSNAYDLSGDEGTLLNTIDGSGVQLDDDWYEISIDPGYENVTIVLTFTHSAGNIDLALYNSTGNLLTSSASTTDNEYINYIVSSSGTYYIKVYGDDAGNSYNLIWSSLEYTPPGGGGPEVPGYDLLFLFGVITAISIITIRKLIKGKPILREKY